MMTSQDDVDFETLDEGVGDSVEDTSISLEGQVVAMYHVSHTHLIKFGHTIGIVGIE